MKTKKLQGKLTLRKETLTHLNDVEMNRIAGGYDTVELSCVSQVPTCSCPWSLTCQNTGTHCGKETYDTIICCPIH